MTGPIRQLSTHSTSSGDRHSGTSGSLSSPNYSSGIPATIHENEEGGQARSGPPVYPRLFSPSEHRLAETSPQPLTPGGSKLPTMGGAGGGSAPATLSNAARETFEREAERVARSDVDGAEFSLERLHLPDGAARAESLDPKMLAPRKTDPTAAAREQQAVGASSAEGETDGDGVWRKDQLPSAAERNARLEKMEEG